jgi:ABC-type transport system involved in multi-copper enzyme maturation permease subunit
MQFGKLAAGLAVFGLIVTYLMYEISTAITIPANNSLAPVVTSMENLWITVAGLFIVVLVIGLYNLFQGSFGGSGGGGGREYQ